MSTEPGAGQIAAITDSRKHPIENGHLIYLDGSAEEIQQRGTYKHKHWEISEIDDLVENIEAVYERTKKTIVCTRGRTATQVVREVASVIFLDDYNEVDIERQLKSFSSGAR